MRRVFITAGIILVLDQITKVLIVQVLNLRERGEIDALAPLLNLRMAWNRGINFGLMAGDSDVMRWVLIAVALVITVWVIWWMRSETRAIAHVAGGFLVGGAIGNVIDRIVYGAVADFLNISCCGIENPYSFNVADISIFIGAVGLVLFTGEKKTP